AALTLLGGAGSAAHADPIIGDEGIALLLRELYPGTAAQSIAGLEPDLLGEGMVWRVLSNEGVGAGPYLDRVFERAEPQAGRQGFAVLGRLSEDHSAAPPQPKGRGRHGWQGGGAAQSSVVSRESTVRRIAGWSRLRSYSRPCCRTLSKLCRCWRWDGG